MVDESKPWNHWWFWLFMIPIAGIMIPLSALLPFNEPWFWITAGVVSLSVYHTRRKHALGGSQADFQQLQAEVRELKAKMLRQELSAQLLNSQELSRLERESFGKGIVVILFSDIEGFTTYVEAHGDEAAHQQLKLHNDIVRRTIQRHGGAEIKHLGDGFMIHFSSARDALLCAAQIQLQFKALGDEQSPLLVRIGIHAGEPIREERDFIGRTVILAQRIMSQARGGQVYVSEVVKNLVGPLKGFQYVDQGLRKLEGITEAQRLYEFQAIDALAVPLDSVVDRDLETLEQRMRRRG